MAPQQVFFRSSRGLRQGDPLSPYLFVIGMEVSSYLLQHAIEENFLSGCKFEGRGAEVLSISHLLYADDTVPFCEANQEQLMHLGWTLMWFKAVLGLKNNLSKSEIIPMGVWKEIRKDRNSFFQNAVFSP